MMESPFSRGERASPSHVGTNSNSGLALGGRSVSPTSNSTLPTVNQKVAVEGWCRGGRLRHHKFNPNLFQEGEASLLFVDDGKGGKRESVMRTLEEPLVDARRQVGMKNPVERKTRGPTTSFRGLVALGHNGGSSRQQLPTLTESQKGGITVPLTDSSSQCTETSRNGVQQRSRRMAKNVLEYDPKTYSELLPATLRMHKAGCMQSEIVSSVAVNELLAERDAQQANRGNLAMNGEGFYTVSLQELQGFLGEMNQFQERGKYMRRRWKRHLPCVEASTCAAIRMVNEDDDTSSDSLHETDSDDKLKLTLSKRQQQTSEATRAAISTWREEINALQLQGDKSRGAVLLRNEIKKSRRAAVKASQGVTLSNLLMIQNESNVKTPKEEVKREPLKESHRLSAEDISWRTENTMSQRTVSPTSPGLAAAGGVGRTNDAGSYHGDERKDSNSDIVQRRLAMQLISLLNRGKGTMVYGLDNTRRNRSCRTQQNIPTVNSLPSLQPTSGKSSPTDFSMTWTGEPQKNLELKARQNNYSIRQPWRPLPVEYGVGEQSSLRFKALITQWRLQDCQMEVKNQEDIRRTRELLHELIPRRVALLDESLKCSRENARIILQKHRQQIFKRVAEKDYEERKQACFAYVDLLEESYSGVVAEGSLAAIRKALQKTRDLIKVSPTRCNARNYQIILKEYFLIAQLVEVPVRELLWRLAELFGMTRAQYKTAMSNTYQLLNTPRDYQARFREIERTIACITAPTERRIRLTLHRCRFLLANNTLGTSHGFSAIGSERNRELSDIYVQIKSENQVFISTAVRARVSNDDDTFSWNVSRRDGEHSPLCGANFMDQAFRFNFGENAELEVALLRNGLVVASGKFCLSDCTFNLRGIAVLWLRLSGEGGAEAEVKLTLAMLAEKNQQKKTLRN
ncbi:hypothetical protein MOQ_000663 [Trypanosoma cruzi marinkellei]|uniref:Uncharacterized protein n=1 Tax=Trypanosoma cruzi marinkellei TaxID=85056 RepID=K2NID4_TRYCR|nr:hypothetical protein MOQ_000663 [Trypanosoma cruzi marinkellei]